jgi:N-acyl-D-aspartate/D-glutamate deacylase
LAVYAAAPADCRSLADFFAYCLRQFDIRFRWWLDVANIDADITDEILFDDNTLPGFNDSGADITNLAFYDCNLLNLQIAQRTGLNKVAIAVKRLTRDPAEFFNLDVGGLEPGEQADLVLINPEPLKLYDSNKNRQLVYNPAFEHDVLVNRSDGVVEQVYIRGVRIWESASQFTEALGQQTLGRALTAAR